jgi:hypothetical protein
MKHKALVLMLTILLGPWLTGCSALGVEPWEREQLARGDMALDNDALELATDDHIYFSKEGSSGGRAFAGGGCGCN